MPTYEYKCTTCDERFEIEQSIKAATLKTLPGDDHRHQLKKIFSPVGISFKGEGFYRNDARGKKASTSTAADKAPTKVNSDGTKTDAPKSEPAKTSENKKSEKSESKKSGSTASASD